MAIIHIVGNNTDYYGAIDFDTGSLPIDDFCIGTNYANANASYIIMYANMYPGSAPVLQYKPLGGTYSTVSPMNNLSSYGLTVYSIGFINRNVTSSDVPVVVNLTDGNVNSLYNGTSAQAVRDYFDSSAAPYMDIDCYTSGADGNKLVTLEWDNIYNIPAGMYSSSYFITVLSGSSGGDAGGTRVAVCPYRDKIYQVLYGDLFNALSEVGQQQAMENDYLYITCNLCHTEGERTIIDQSAKFKIDRVGTATTEHTEGGGTVTPHSNTSPRPNGDYDGSTGDIDASGTGQALAIDNIITTSYAVTEQQLNDFGDWLWTNDLSTTVFGNQVAPIENVLSCKRIPFDVATATNTNIWLGNINSNVACVLASTNHYQNIGSIQIPTPCGGTFLDEQNNVSIYLPYCGIQSIPTSICYDKTLYTVTLPNGFTKQIPKLTGRTLTVKYVYDMIYGTCAALLYMDSNLFGVYNGTCGVDIPLTASNRASNQLALQKDGGNMITGIITSAVGGAVSGGMSGGLLGAAIGGIIGAGESALGGALRTKNNAMTQETHFTTSGGFSSQIASFMSPNVTIFVEYTDIGTIPDSYAHENGYPCNLDLNLSDLVGYTELDGAIEISNIPCLEEERILLKQALQDGFYL